ncbi:hypothetical protein COV82_03410 [Candidatus Peregrinibacteria bacterium CG11_big_fil_rev_8_21_14_0_20_46_8]|nr:MAG: hypothetical protein COV82_03410 [Candidatus Peregrinibacteria bacterium CG11_big_fil_rev_8_21_14_0_20_46_8]
MDTNQPIDPNTQAELNQPLEKKEGISQEDQAFLHDLVAKVESGQIDLHKPSSLINEAVYSSLPEDKRGKVDFDAVNLLTQCRNIYELWKATGQASFQIENMVRQVRLTKERLEGISGDVYII